ncbi:unnamed protein product [Eruca vesicaria subsp. sativa]|uniref:Uncharacterized protein n=1 Tax=Eruca vesicaria subsp. sativa TaxID=29727 RepID=A0ABC8LE10_ERUVS|nr:unnamed protein product [Eruca vesicaria subsp. sativa]
MGGRKIVATSTHEEFAKFTPRMAGRLDEAKRSASSPSFLFWEKVQKRGPWNLMGAGATWEDSN